MRRCWVCAPSDRGPWRRSEPPSRRQRRPTAGRRIGGEGGCPQEGSRLSPTPGALRVHMYTLSPPRWETRVMRSQRRRQRPPDWPTLTARLDGLCRERGVLTRGGRPNDKHLAVACGVNQGLLLAWRRREQWPSRASVAAV